LDERRPLTCFGWGLVLALASLVLLTHLQNFLFGICAIGACLLFCRASLRRRLLVAACFVPSLLTLTWWQLTAKYARDAADERSGIVYGMKLMWDTRKLDLLRGNWPILTDVLDRIRAFPVHMLRGFADGVDQTASGAVLLALAAFILCGIAALFLPARQE